MFTNDWFLIPTSQRYPGQTETDGKRRRGLIVSYLRECIESYLLLHARGVTIEEKLREIENFREQGLRKFADEHDHDDDRSDGYNLRDEAINLMCFYLCPKKTRPYTVAEYVDDLVRLFGPTWPSECWNYMHYRNRMRSLYNNEVVLSDSD
ncbi:hypothetical protein R1sor_013997 [Riccia sorocarpa]|uniref:Uncharacterized protein n=1 Tax=Riccia sorocarpa TaxID=122646 RepID=A0ABD3H8B0_9MARC